MQDGTYLFKNGSFLRIEATEGYWVATRETELSNLKDGQIIGVWQDPATGRTWLDETTFVGDLATATITAKAYDQIAIWDNANQATISTL
jgi:hypothetical protein